MTESQKQSPETKGREREFLPGKCIISAPVHCHDCNCVPWLSSSPRKASNDSLPAVLSLFCYTVASDCCYSFLAPCASLRCPSPAHPCRILLILQSAIDTALPYPYSWGCQLDRLQQQRPSFAMACALAGEPFAGQPPNAKAGYVGALKGAPKQVTGAGFGGPLLVFSAAAAATSS